MVNKIYTQFDTPLFTVNNKDTKKPTNNIRSHIKKHHLSGALTTKIYNVPYGANSII
jgi:hypothetical protein